MASHNPSRIINICLIGLILVTFGFVRPSPVLAAGTILVNTTLDVYGGNACSLRNAIHAANINTPFGGCPAGNTIQLPAGNFKLTILNPGNTPADESAGDLNISTSMTITGAGRQATQVYAASQAFGDRIFQINNVDVNIQNMKISGGYSPFSFGGGIYNQNGNLVLTGVIVDGNTAYYGGGIANLGGTLTVANSTVSNNASNLGGGIFNTSIVTITHSTVAYNNFSSSGGGLNNYLVSSAPTATIINSTIAFNKFVRSADFLGVPSGGGLSSAGTLVIQYSTIADNDWAGVYINGGSLTIGDTILARSLNKPDCIIKKDASTNTYPTVTSGGYNLVDAVGQATDPEAVCPFGTTDILNKDALLSSIIMSNAGATRTYGFVKNGSTFSPAIDAIPVGDPSCPVDDQRGFVRPVDGNGDTVAQCDIGAYEERQLYFINLPITRR